MDDNPKILNIWMINKKIKKEKIYIEICNYFFIQTKNFDNNMSKMWFGMT